jgi:surfeit locus 1 family protein
MANRATSKFDGTGPTPERVHSPVLPNTREAPPNGENATPLLSEGFRALIGPGIITLIGVAILCGLGVWQLERMVWKEGLLAAIAERVGAEPVDFPPESAWATLTREHDEYRHVRLTGQFLNDKEAHLQANLVHKGPNEGALGYNILTPLRQGDGSLIIVNRGFVPLDKKDAATRADGQIEGATTITGLLRFPQTHPWFAPADDPAKNVWFSRDPAPIARAYGLARVAPMIVDADAGEGKSKYPIGGATLIDIPNDHLQYALTWFALAGALLAVFAVYARRRLRPLANANGE